jgi:histidine phosphotransfer protein HptB
MPQKTIFAMLNLLTDQIDRQSVVDLVDLFVVNGPRQMLAIRTAANNRDLKTMWFEAHGLKSSSANLGASDLSHACFKIEKSTMIDKQTKDLIESADQLLQQTIGIMTDWKKSNR